jgi:hypothetical protein
MSLNLQIKQMPLGMTRSHADHTWNIQMNDYSAYTDIRLVVDIYKNPYLNDSGSTQDSGKVARLLVPVNEVGHCIFNVETIIVNLVDKNPRNLGGISTTGITGTELMDPYLVRVANSQTTSISANTSQATIVNDRTSTISFSNGFNGGYEGFSNIYQINEYRCLFGVQFTSGGTTNTIIPTNYSAYTSYTGGTISPYSAETQPYGVMIWPGVMDNKQLSTKYYYSGNNLTGQYNYLDTKVYDWQMSTGSTRGEFMSTFGSETIPMTILGSNVYQTRWRTHYYKCPIVIGFMYGGNPLYNNTTQVGGIMYLQKTNGNGQYNYDTIQSNKIDFTSRLNLQTVAPYSYLQQRIAYGVFKPNPTIRTDSDVAIYLTNGVLNYDYDVYGSSEIVQYKMVGEECLNDPISFLFMTRNGIWDTYTFTKKSEKRYAPNKKTYSQQKSLNTKWWNRQSYDSSETVFFGYADEIMTIDSGYVLQNDGVIIEELLLSPYVYMIMDNWLPSNNQDFIYPYLIPCNILNKDVKVFQQKYQRIFQYTMEVRQTPYRQYDLAI